VRQFLGIAGPAFDLGDEPHHQAPVVGAVGRAADVVLENEILGITLRQWSIQLARQGGLAHAGIAEEKREVVLHLPAQLGVSPSILSGLPQDSVPSEGGEGERSPPLRAGLGLEVVRPADVSAAAISAKASWSRASRVSKSGCSPRKLQVNGGFQVSKDDRGESLRVAVVFAERDVLGGEVCGISVLSSFCFSALAGSLR